MTVDIEIKFEDTGKVIQTAAGRRLVDICDEFSTHLLFGCRSAACGTCLIEVLDGQDVLSPVTEEEEVLIDALAEGNPRARLGCQCTVNGSVTIRSLEA